MNHSSLPIFLGAYPIPIRELTLAAIEWLEMELPEIQPQLDLPAKMIAFAYTNSYSAMVCVVIPSQKEIKIGFSKGSTMADPDHLLEGTGKLSRYVRIQNQHQLENPGLKKLVHQANDLYLNTQK